MYSSTLNIFIFYFVSIRIAARSCTLCVTFQVSCLICLSYGTTAEICCIIDIIFMNCSCHFGTFLSFIFNQHMQLFGWTLFVKQQSRYTNVSFSIYDKSNVYVKFAHIPLIIKAEMAIRDSSEIYVNHKCFMRFRSSMFTYISVNGFSIRVLTRFRF